MTLFDVIEEKEKQAAEDAVQQQSSSAAEDAAATATEDIARIEATEVSTEVVDATESVDLPEQSESVEPINPADVLGKRVGYTIFAFRNDKWVASYTEARSLNEMLERCKQQFPEDTRHCGAPTDDVTRENAYPHQPVG